MKTRTWRSNYFCGNKISEYGLDNGYVDYATLSKAFDAVLVNDITKLFYADINGEYNEAEQINGYIDNSDEIEELEEQIELLKNSISEAGNLPEDEQIEEQIEELEEQIEELEREQDEIPEIYHYYIVSSSGADIIQEYTNDPLYYLPVIDAYVWGITHYGTSWNYVLTDIKIDLSEE